MYVYVFNRISDWSATKHLKIYQCTRMFHALTGCHRWALLITFYSYAIMFSPSFQWPCGKIKKKKPDHQHQKQQHFIILPLEGVRSMKAWGTLSWQSWVPGSYGTLHLTYSCQVYIGYCSFYDIVLVLQYRETMKGKKSHSNVLKITCKESLGLLPPPQKVIAHHQSLLQIICQQILSLQIFAAPLLIFCLKCRQLLPGLVNIGSVVEQCWEGAEASFV